ncbi:MAG: DNA repair exonuclease [Pseudomonadota bacterium]
MPSFSFIHTADLHLDSPFSGLCVNNPELAGPLRSATFEAVDNIIQLCIQKRVDFLLVAGDVFDEEDKGLRAQVKFRDGLKRLHEAGIRSFVVHGNHDPLNGWSSTLSWPEGVHVFRDHIETVKVERDGVLLASIQGISYPKRDERRNLSRLFKRTDPSFHIGLLHANVGSDTGHEPYAPCSLVDLLHSEIDYWALGHVHNRRILSSDVPIVIYSGNTQGRNIRERGERGCYFVKVGEDREVDLEFHPTDVIRWEEAELSINNLQSEQDLIDSLDHLCSSIINNASGRSVVARITLTGRGPLYPFLRRPNAVTNLFELLQEKWGASSPFLSVEQIRLRVNPEIDIEQRKKGQDFLSELLHYSQEVSEEGPLDELAKKELALLFEDSRARKYISIPDRRTLRSCLQEAEKICIDFLEGEDVE